MLFYPYIDENKMIYPTEEQSRTPVRLSACRIGDVVRLPTGQAHWQLVEHLPHNDLVELKSDASTRQYSGETLVYPVAYASYPQSPRQEIKVKVIRNTEGKLLGVEIYQNGRVISPPFERLDEEKRFTETIFHDLVD